MSKHVMKSIKSSAVQVSIEKSSFDHSTRFVIKIDDFALQKVMQGNPHLKQMFHAVAYDAQLTPETWMIALDTIIRALTQPTPPKVEDYEPVLPPMKDTLGGLEAFTKAMKSSGIAFAELGTLLGEPQAPTKAAEAKAPHSALQALLGMPLGLGMQELKGPDGTAYLVNMDEFALALGKGAGKVSMVEKHNPAKMVKVNFDASAGAKISSHAGFIPLPDGLDGLTKAED